MGKQEAAASAVAEISVDAAEETLVLGPISHQMRRKEQHRRLSSVSNMCLLLQPPTPDCIW